MIPKTTAYYEELVFKQQRKIVELEKEIEKLKIELKKEKEYSKYLLSL